MTDTKPPSALRRPSTVAKITCVAGACTALIGLGYILAGSVAVIDIGLLVGGMFVALAGLLRLLRRSPPT